MACLLTDQESGLVLEVLMAAWQYVPMGTPQRGAACLNLQNKIMGSLKPVNVPPQEIVPSKDGKGAKEKDGKDAKKGAA